MEVAVSVAANNAGAEPEASKVNATGGCLVRKENMAVKWKARLPPIVRVRPGWLLTLGVAISLTIVSCSTVERVMVAPPHIPSAKFVGDTKCSECHANHTRDFHTATHSAIKADWNKEGNLGCETCHGPASIHVETGGALRSIVNPKKSPTVCFQCHLEMRGRFNLPHHHPIAQGDVSCSDCHDSHKGPAIRGGATSLAGLNDGCIKCHPAQRGPFAFQHEAVREGCTSCHNPHGSVNAKLLTERNGNLCLKCHVDVRTSTLTVGGLPHAFLAAKGTCWTAGCHEAVHGSHVNSSLRY